MSEFQGQFPVVQGFSKCGEEIVGCLDRRFPVATGGLRLVNIALFEFLPPLNLKEAVEMA